MEANGTCTLPEITSPLKIKCYTLILILLPRLSIYVSNHTKVKLLSCTHCLNSRRLVWKAMRHVRLYSADSNPQRIQEWKTLCIHAVFACNIFHTRREDRREKLQRFKKEPCLWFVAYPQIQFVIWEKGWKRKVHKRPNLKQVWRPKPNTDDGGSKARGSGLLHFFFLTEA